MIDEEKKEFYRLMNKRLAALTSNLENKEVVEKFLILFSDPAEAVNHFSGQIQSTIQSLLDEINSDENNKKMFTHTMGYLIELAELYYNSSCV